MTLVDCPGHASLIRTIIGGAQIIDLMVLVIDVTKGIQTQTAECLVIGEILNDTLVVVLNKLDMLPEPREEKYYTMPWYRLYATRMHAMLCCAMIQARQDEDAHPQDARRDQVCARAADPAVGAAGRRRGRLERDPNPQSPWPRAPPAR